MRRNQMVHRDVRGQSKSNQESAVKQDLKSHGFSK